MSTTTGARSRPIRRRSTARCGSRRGMNASIEMKPEKSGGVGTGRSLGAGRWQPGGCPPSPGRFLKYLYMLNNVKYEGYKRYIRYVLFIPLIQLDVVATGHLDLKRASGSGPGRRRRIILRSVAHRSRPLAAGEAALAHEGLLARKGSKRSPDAEARHRFVQHGITRSIPGPWAPGTSCRLP
jgi:hypothetical protein